MGCWVMELKLAKPERVRAMKDIIADHLREEIVLGALELGQSISEKSYVSKFEVSRTPVREAFLALASEGLIDVKPQSGTFVMRFSEQSLTDLCQVRLMFEATAAKIASSGNTEELVRDLTEIVKRAQGAIGKEPDFELFNRLDYQFHNRLIVACNNRFLLESYETVATRSHVIRNRLPQTSARVRNAQRQHKQLVEAIKRRNVEDVEHLLSAHVEGVQQQLREVPEVVQPD